MSHAIGIKAKKAKQATHHVDGLDTIDWQMEDGIATDRHLRVRILGSDVSGSDGDPTLSYTLSYSGPKHATVSYQLSEEGGMASSTPILGPGNVGLELVIDTIGGMTPKPPDGDEPGEGNHRHPQHND